LMMIYSRRDKKKQKDITIIDLNIQYTLLMSLIRQLQKATQERPFNNTIITTLITNINDTFILIFRLINKIQ